MVIDSADVVYTVVYLLLSFCFIAPPTEFMSAGFTIQNILSSILGSEDMNFVHYHIKRTTSTLVMHSLLPFGYYVGRCLFVSSVRSWTFYWQLYLVASIIAPVAVMVLACYWSRHRWDNHPIATNLQHHATSGSSWRSVASSINIEFRRIDKFATGIHGRRLIVTDTWLIQSMTYYVYVAHQSDIHLNLASSDQHTISHEGQTGAQFLNITVSSINRHVKPFHVRLNALDYRDLRDKLQAPVVNARNVIIQQSLSERFIHAFTEQVMQNNVYPKTPDMELEPCIGCMMKQADVKLQKQCNPDSDECVQCYCRPMWCLQCMGKWFASRQNQSSPETWLAGISPCPTCRSPFCILDVSPIS